ncbi:hypothetical protein MUS1_13045 [Marinomonas ushuaiensis DSM 15871]|uniref:Uncharacterized protein n=1 Tax=Marinomonas ushuaiensis DSM 15871 TaxID=1122207 RepID=X7E4E7_9GAMM|nr:hypothetical protein [Marinomonas ushuaiensis]ETX10899.1 hypothetical protein MUS1_13045 [Marinomonas ushuaiensis DSM 15871]
MKTPYSPFSIPRKELTSRLQQSVVALLFLMLLVFAGLYVLISVNLERQNTQQEKLKELLGVVHYAEQHWLELLLVGDKLTYVDSISAPSLSHFNQMLISEYRLIESKIGDFQLTAEVNMSDAFLLLERLSQRELNVKPLSGEERKLAYLSFEKLKVLDDKLLQIGVDLEYARQEFIERLVLVPIGVLLFIALVVIFMSVGFVRQLRSGFSSLHYALNHHKHGHALVESPRNVVDEFTDLAHYIDKELASRSFDFNHLNEKHKALESTLAKVEEPFFVINNEGDIAWLSAGAERIWLRNSSFFEAMFDVDSGLDSPRGERVADSILFAEEGVQLNLHDGVYWLEVGSFESDLKSEEESLTRFISIKPKSEVAELDVLHHSLKLMEQDVWGIPIRLLRDGSPYMSFAQSLEIVRRKVVMLFNALDVSSSQANSLEKITKLQHVASLINERSTDNESLGSDLVAVGDVLPKRFQVEINDMAWLSEQVRDSLILGYELVLQRLALVEKDLSSGVFVLGDVDRLLNEVRVGVLSSLSASEGESERVRRRFAIDLEHDISSVQNQIENIKTMADSTLSLLESDRSVGMARLDKTRDSINEMIERTHELMAKTTSEALEDKSASERVKN